ncbi:SnoaL-like protein [Novosphingobium sp. PhB165]|uniref:nuclear transport factor 2 family protein n=1 Tax=Novosphingobium sp. PhB165 TaxID=2485105 RepID=UPI0010EE3071|nr:nuclear transport factor 2 family protein [Novosphingobium sp. PhB165]TCM16021.1 SnoaL-like protein [Novosphingobium sp. PhB165]
MLDRDAALQTIRDVYAARVSGDKEALATYWADDARFDFVGERSLLEPVGFSSESSMDQIGQLIDRFRFSDLELLDAVVEGEKIAARWEVTVAAEGKEPVRTQLFDLITLDEEGKIRSFIQFTDTALVRHVAA